MTGAPQGTTRILCTHPGRYGDLLWALPTVRAISQTFDATVDLMTSRDYGTASFLSLFKRHTTYIEMAWPAADWAIIPGTAPPQPRTPPTIPTHSRAYVQEPYEYTIHLGYDGWPSWPLPIDTYKRAQAQLLDRIVPAPLDLETPWIRTPRRPVRERPLIAVGFSDEAFELKYGLYRLLVEHFGDDPDEGHPMVVNVACGPRWTAQRGPQPWYRAASDIAASSLFVGCCSAMHVLACAVGTPCLLVEPATLRQQPVFYPYGSQGPRVELLRNSAHEPSVDSRDLIDRVSALLSGSRAALERPS